MILGEWSITGTATFWFPEGLGDPGLVWITRAKPRKGHLYLIPTAFLRFVNTLWNTCITLWKTWMKNIRSLIEAVTSLTKHLFLIPNFTLPKKFYLESQTVIFSCEAHLIPPQFRTGIQSFQWKAKPVLFLTSGSLGFTRHLIVRTGSLKIPKPNF